MVRMGDVTPTIWDHVVPYMEFRFGKDYGFQEEDLLKNWKSSADALMKERHLFEIYGNEAKKLRFVFRCYP